MNITDGLLEDMTFVDEELVINGSLELIYKELAIIRTEIARIEAALKDLQIYNYSNLV